MKKLKRQEKADRLRQFIEMADKVVVSTEALTEVVLAEAKPSAPVSIIGDAVEQDIEKVTVPLWRSWVGSMKAQRWTRRLRAQRRQGRRAVVRSEEHTSELQSLMRISYAVFCLKKKKKKDTS